MKRSTLLTLIIVFSLLGFICVGCGILEKGAQSINYETITDCFGDLELIYPSGDTVKYNSVWIEYGASEGSIFVSPEGGSDFVWRGNFKFNNIHLPMPRTYYYGGGVYNSTQ